MTSIERSYRPEEDFKSYERRLRSLSEEVIPVFHSEDHPTLESFVAPIFEESLALSQAIQDDEMSYSSVNKNLLLVVGAPGSGKTYVVDELHKMRKRIGLPDEHFHEFSWEGAADEVKETFTEEEKNETYFSDNRMLQANDVAIDQLNNSGSWMLGIGEYAPVATKINLGGPVWMGKDAGATFIEYVTQNRPDINVHIIGLCPESRVVRLATPFRKRGATPEQVKGYRDKSTSLALTLHEARKIDLPRYMVEMLRRPEINVNPLEDKEFVSIFGESIEEFARVLVEKKRKGTGQKGYIKEYSRILKNTYSREIAKDDVVSLASLYMYKASFMDDLALPESNIFLGVSNPKMRKLLNAPVDWNKVF